MLWDGPFTIEFRLIIDIPGMTLSLDIDKPSDVIVPGWNELIGD